MELQNIAYENGNIALHGVRLELPPSVQVNNLELLRKSELHICLVCVRKIVELTKNPADEKRILEFCRSFFIQHPATFRLLPEHRLAKKEDRISVIAMCEVPGLEELFAGLEQLLGVVVPRQPTHVTLFTIGQDKGIELATPEELTQFSQPLPDTQKWSV